MLMGRRNFGCCQYGGYVYAIGGVVKGGGLTKTCERYDITNNKWEQIPNLKHAVVNPSVCSYKGSRADSSCLFKFGGHFDGQGSVGLQWADNKQVEKYDIVKNEW